MLRALLYVKGVENDGSDFNQTMLSTVGALSADGNTKGLKEKIDPAILEKNRQLKLDCYNNLSGKSVYLYHNQIVDNSKITISSMFTTDC